MEHTRVAPTTSRRRGRALFVAGSIVVSSVVAFAFVSHRRPDRLTGVTGDLEAFDIRLVDNLDSSSNSWLDFSPSGDLAILSRYRAADDGGDVYLVDVDDQELHPQLLVEDGRTLAEVHLTYSDRFITASLYTCDGGIHEGDAGLLCDDYDSGVSELRVLDRDKGAWSDVELPYTRDGIYFERIGDTLYFAYPALTGSVASGTEQPIASVLLPDGELTPEPDIHVQNLDQLAERLGASRPLDPSPTGFGSRNAASGLNASMAPESRVSGSTVTIDAEDDALTIERRGYVASTDGGVFLEDSSGRWWVISHVG